MTDPERPETGHDDAEIAGNGRMSADGGNDDEAGNGWDSETRGGSDAEAGDGWDSETRGGGDAEAGNVWDADEYDGDHSFVYEYGADLLGLLEPAPEERILDLGCGTGHLTAQVAESGAHVVGVDRSASMLETASGSHPEHPFVVADARALPLASGFDAAFSNAALHWIDATDQDAVLAGVHDSLAPEGRFVGELGGLGNVGAIVDAVGAELGRRGYETGTPWYFPSIGEYATRLERAGFEVRHARLFDRPTPLEDGEDGLRNWLEMFGDGLFAAVPADEREGVYRAVEDRLRPTLYGDGRWIADYRRLRFLAVRP